MTALAVPCEDVQKAAAKFSNVRRKLQERADDQMRALMQERIFQLKDMTPKSFAPILPKMSVEYFAAGSIILQSGDENSGMVLLVSGTCETATVPDPDDGDEDETEDGVGYVAEHIIAGPAAAILH